MIPRFGRPVPQVSMIVSEMTIMYREKLNSPWLAPAELEIFAQAIQNVGPPLTNCWGFVDGTVRRICRPGEIQRTVYNGHKRVHAIKFQAIATPDGLVANLYGAVEVDIMTVECLLILLFYHF